MQHKPSIKTCGVHNLLASVTSSYQALKPFRLSRSIPSLHSVSVETLPLSAHIRPCLSLWERPGRMALTPHRFHFHCTLRRGKLLQVFPLLHYPTVRSLHTCSSVLAMPIRPSFFRDRRGSILPMYGRVAWHCQANQEGHAMGTRFPHRGPVLFFHNIHDDPPEQFIYPLHR